MPSRSSQYPGAYIFRSTLLFTLQIWDAFKANPSDANIMSAHALKTRNKELTGEHPPPDQLWIVYFSEDGTIDLVLSCTKGPLGNYPIFLFSPDPSAQHDGHFLQPRIEDLVHVLHEEVGPRRAYSVFAPRLITTIFVDYWARLTFIPFYTIPYYAAKLAHCTRHSFVNRSVTIHPDYNFELRLAMAEDIPEAAQLCYHFAQTSDPFFLSEANAMKEATLLVQNGQLWVHRIKRPGEPSEIASIVAVTRDSEPVSAITKVFTSEHWRKRGCAERLVRYVCKNLLMTRDEVILFVAHDNIAANKVYDRVGFVSANNWLEIGFDRSLVDLGHW